MKLRENETAGPVTDFLMEDHRRLETLLQSAVAHADQVDRGGRRKGDRLLFLNVFRRPRLRSVDPAEIGDMFCPCTM